jgi:hypothetical protein
MAGRRIRRSLGVLLAAGSLLAAAVALAPGASARPQKSDIHEEFPEVLEDFCGQAGLTITTDVVIDGRNQTSSRRPGTPPFYHERINVTAAFFQGDVHVATQEDRLTSKDLKITDRGDGTVTILVLATGNSTVYDSAGRAIARNPGQTRFEILVDLGGTPSDPGDDEVIDFLGIVKESTGRTDDHCAAVLGELA